MRGIISALGGILIILGALPAHAAAVVLNSGSAGTAFSVDFTGQVNGSPATQLSALLNVTLNSVSSDGRVYTFGYDLTNDSTVASRIRGFGFDVDGGVLSGAGVTGAFVKAQRPGFFPGFAGGTGDRDVCFAATTNGNGCTGGQGGVTTGQTGTGTFSLTFKGSNPAPSSIYLDLFVVRYQSISPAINGETSGIGIGQVVPPPPAVPEPGTWLMMIFGFFALGFVMRQRKAAETGLPALG